MNVLVTGHSGFSGSHFLEQYAGVPLVSGDEAQVDLRDPGAVQAAVEQARPEAVLHLAALTFVPASFKDPRTTFDVNLMGTLNLLTALEGAGFKGRMICVSSSEVYGLVQASHLPLTEAQPIRPANPYAASKAAMEALAFQWSQTCGFEVVIARPFNHTGARQDDPFVVSNFAKQVAAIHLGQQPAVIEVGDLDVTRDFTDVRDVARAYHLLLGQGRNGEVYNVCSGVEQSLTDVLNTLVEIGGVEVRVARADDRLRPSQQRRVAGSAEKLRATTGWRPEVPFRQTLTDVFNYWKERLQ